MVTDNVTDLSLLINQQLESREVLRQYGEMIVSFKQNTGGVYDKD